VTDVPVSRSSGGSPSLPPRQASPEKADKRMSHPPGHACGGGPRSGIEASSGRSAVRLLPRRNEVWIGQHDQLLRFDLVRTTMSDAVRLRNDESGSFIEALWWDPSEKRCAASYALRSWQPPVAVPSGGRVLVFDVDAFEVVGAADAPDWVTDVALLSNDRVCGQLWKDDTMWLGHIRGAAPALSPAGTWGGTGCDRLSPTRVGATVRPARMSLPSRTTATPRTRLSNSCAEPSVRISQRGCRSSRSPRRA
jgi:hypothetical protein